MKLFVYFIFFTVCAFSKTAIKLTDLEKNKTALPTVESNVFEKKQADLNDIKPPKIDLFTSENKDQAQYEKALDKQIDELYALTKEFKSNPKRGELWLRLAELYIEKANIISDRLVQIYEKEKRNSENHPEILVKPLDLTTSKAYNSKSKQLYEWYLKEFPNGEKNDLALFYLAYQNYELNNINESIEQYKLLVEKYPKSLYKTESHFVIAENYFDNEKWSEALKHYPYVIENESSPYYTLALYKAAWCLFRTDNSKLAIENMHKVIKFAKKHSSESTLSGKKINSSTLDGEAIRDLVVFYGESNRIDEALLYFKSLNSQVGDNSIEKLAYFLSSKGNIASSKKVFKFLISQNPNSIKSFDYQFQITQNYFFSQNKAEFKSELKELVTQYGIRSKWFATNSKEDKLLAESNQKREQVLRNYILQQHQFTQNTRVDTSFLDADEGYKFYFQEFSDSNNAGDMHFLYGELLYDMSKYVDAAREYEIVVDNYTNSQYFQKATLNLVLSLEKTLPEIKDYKKTDSDLKEKPLDTASDKFIKYTISYLSLHPEYSKSIDLKFRIARLLYENNHFEQAEKIFKEIIVANADTQYTDYSANLILDIYNLKNDYEGLEKSANELLSYKSIADSKLDSEIKSILEKTNFKKADLLQAKGLNVDAAKKYTGFASQYPNSALVGMAFYNAAINYEKISSKQDSVEYYEKALKNKSVSEDPNMSLQSKTSLAKFYQDSGNYAASADLYFQLSQNKISNNADIIKFTFNAALMFELVSNHEKSISSYERYLLLEKNEKDKANTIFRMAEISRKNSKFKDAHVKYAEYIKCIDKEPIKSLEAEYWLIALQNAKPAKTQLDKLKIKMNSALTASDDSKTIQIRQILAKIYLSEAEEYFNAFKLVKISNQPSKQQQTINKRLDLLKKINEKIAEVINTSSSEELVSAFYLLGEANYNMVQAFESVSIPADLTDDEKKSYLAELSQIIDPFRQKMTESYKLAVDRGRELGVYSSAYQQSLKQLTYSMPNDYFWGNEIVNSNLRSKNLNSIKTKDELTKLLLVDNKNFEALNDLAMYYYNNKQYAASSLLIESAIRSYPNDSNSYNNMGLILFSSGKEPQAMLMFTKALELDSNNYEAASNLSTLYVTNKDYSKPINKLSILEDEKIISIGSLLNYAILLRSIGKIEKAEQIYKKVLELEPQNEKALINYSILNIKELKNPAKAIQMLSDLKKEKLKPEIKTMVIDLEVEAKRILK